DWRERIAQGVADADLPVRLDGPVCVHEDSDDCAAAILGAEDKKFWHDHKAAKMNAIRIRTRTLISEADIVVARFGDKYRQWNAAFDAGTAAALGKALISLHDAPLTHALKEVDGAASAVCETPEQVVQTLAYVIRGQMPSN
ncbi:MAG: YtoQ family protein, partial [Rhodospirillales bacterium]|nr:YtoQ family protein [Rhodospirillales bacterium]